MTRAPITARANCRFRSSRDFQAGQGLPGFLVTHFPLAILLQLLLQDGIFPSHAHQIKIALPDVRLAAAHVAQALQTRGGQGDDHPLPFSRPVTA